jgi:hypothetical protein
MEEDYRTRVKEEKKDLDQRIIKLANFLTTTEFMALPVDERKRLRKQSLIMSKYSEILEERILHFPVSQ